MSFSERLAVVYNEQFEVVSLTPEEKAALLITREVAISKGIGKKKKQLCTYFGDFFKRESANSCVLAPR